MQSTDAAEEVPRSERQTHDAVAGDPLTPSGRSCGGSSTRFARVAGAVTSGPSLEDEIERGFGDPPEATEAGTGDDVADACLARLGAQSQAALLGEGRRSAKERREGV